jgi:hypothetical protein
MLKINWITCLLILGCAAAVRADSDESNASNDAVYYTQDQCSDCSSTKISCDEQYPLKPYYYGAPDAPGYFWRWPYRN